MKNITCIEDLRLAHKRRVPKAFFDYADRGSYSEDTLLANCRDFQDIKFRQRVLVDLSRRDLSTTVLGEVTALPLILAPVGFGGLQHGDGEIHACRAAEAAGIPYTLSMMSICSMEDVAQSVRKPFWFQISFLKDRGLVKALVDRAIAVGCTSLVLTVDMQLLAQRHADIKNGMTVPPRWSLGKILDFASKPGWVSGVMMGKRRTFGNLSGQNGTGADDIRSLAEWTASQLDSSFGWKDVEWIRSIWPRKLVIKGILDSQDAREAIRAGGDAVVVSNHGGRQLDGARSTIAVLPEIVEAVGSQTEVLIDGGIRSGQDVVRALALGARSCMIGRAYIYGLGADGQRGVAKAIELIAKELEVTMGLGGVARVADIDRHILAPKKA